MLWWRVTDKSGAEFYVNLTNVTDIRLPDKRLPGGLVALTNGGVLQLSEQVDRLELIEDVVLQSSKVDRHAIKTVGATEKVNIIGPVEVRQPIGKRKRPFTVRVELDSPHLLRLKRKVVRRWRDAKCKLRRLKPWG